MEQCNNKSDCLNVLSLIGREENYINFKFSLYFEDKNLDKADAAAGGSNPELSRFRRQKSTLDDRRFRRVDLHRADRLEHEPRQV
jgi:hypothetical protein